MVLKILLLLADLAILAFLVGSIRLTARKQKQLQENYLVDLLEDRQVEREKHNRLVGITLFVCLAIMLITFLLR
jgi:hypothetical protein